MFLLTLWVYVLRSKQFNFGQNFCSDAYKEFEKEIQDNLREVDDRLEEEEVEIWIVILEIILLYG